MDEDLWAAFDNDVGNFDPDYDYLDAPGELPQHDNPPLLPDSTPSPQSTANPFYAQYTHSRRSAIASDQCGFTLEQRVECSLEAILAQGLNLEIFLDAIFWGDAACVVNTRVRHERTVFMNSATFPSLLDRWWASERAGRGRAQLQDFVMDRAGHVLEKEITSVVPRFRAGPDPLSQASLTAVNFREFGVQLQNSGGTPYLWRVLQRLACSPRQERENTIKNPFHVILTIISMLSYARSHDSCVLTMIWSIYLKACGLSARAFDALHMLGLTMSHKWTATAFGQIAQAAKVARRRAIRDRPHFGSHDNLNFPMRVFSQRLRHLTHFICASAATIWILPMEALLPPDIATKVREQRRRASASPFSLLDISTNGESTTSSRVAAQARYRVLCFLLESPSFKDYPHRNHPLLAAPPPTDLLPCGAGHVTEQHILETVEVDESSYEGTDELCNKIWLEQMGYTDAEKQRLGREGLLRMEWIEPVFGWFHALMAFANSLHTQYLGTSAGIGLRKVFETLGRKSLLKAETKGVFWHHLDEALWHVGEANFISLWAAVGKVNEISELAKKTPDELVAILDEIVSNHASRNAIENMDSIDIPDSARDNCKQQAVLFSTDILAYFDLQEAMKIGDVGRMEDLLPTLLYHFLGGGNHKYAVEILELLHKLREEWPDELRQYIRRYCWLVNFTGARDGFLAVDMAQEHNIKDIKVTWRSFGPGATFPYIQKVSPAIPVLRAVKQNIASQFPSVRARGSRHGAPSKDEDMCKLVDMYNGAEVHQVRPGRKIKGGPTDNAADFVTNGVMKLMLEGVFERWWSERSFQRATTETYTLEEATSEDTSTAAVGSHH
ncbi:hypothetical protein BN946_scf185013.g6 [Trametes cinnabarina]|uniref:DUF6589 domain-containing protein n=1 Tax=Pycnoporus cinnabarinus TaxID=5643 RepID=A0A060SLS3_PYCCI|nr:hypothetical protein BN946_scf185013.g6 [Trametes cinnabarina]